MRIIVRTTADTSRVRALFNKVCHPDEWPEISDRTALFLASKGGVDLGFLIADNVDDFAYVTHCGVDHASRGLGIHRRLIEKMCSWATLEGCAAVITYVLANNHASLVNFLKCGFQLYEPEYAWVGREGIMYVRRML